MEGTGWHGGLEAELAEPTEGWDLGEGDKRRRILVVTSRWRWDRCE